MLGIQDEYRVCFTTFNGTLCIVNIMVISTSWARHHGDFKQKLFDFAFGSTLQQIQTIPETFGFVSPRARLHSSPVLRLDVQVEDLGGELNCMNTLLIVLHHCV